LGSVADQAEFGPKRTKVEERGERESQENRDLGVNRKMDTAQDTEYDVIQDIYE